MKDLIYTSTIIYIFVGANFNIRGVKSLQVSLQIVHMNLYNVTYIYVGRYVLIKYSLLLLWQHHNKNLTHHFDFV